MADTLHSAAALVGGITGDVGPVLDLGKPLESARDLLRRHYWHGSWRTLHHQSGGFYVWTGTHYRELPEEEACAEICRFLDGAARIKGDSMVPFDPTPQSVAAVEKMLRLEVQLPGSIRAPAWLDPVTGMQPRHMPTTQEFFSCSNGLLHLPTGKLYGHTPAFFGLNVVDYPYDPTATAPAWCDFLDSILPGDREAIGVLQEMFGYLLSGTTAMQKAFLIVGPPRSGKGTLGRVLKGMLGAPNIEGPTLASLAERFGLQPLIGKLLAIISDARLSGRTDQSVVVERLLSITGEDALTIDRKNREAWTGQLSTRFLVLTNELPRLTDSSGAFASRWVLLQLRQDFRGREDHDLLGRLLLERAGVLNWAREGWQRLAERGRFVHPASSREAIAMLEDLSSPMAAFVRDCAVIEPACSVVVEDLYRAWVRWCSTQGRDRPGNVQTFGRNLAAAFPSVKVTRPRSAIGTRVRQYEGIGLVDAPDTTTVGLDRLDYAAAEVRLN